MFVFDGKNGLGMHVPNGQKTNTYNTFYSVRNANRTCNRRMNPRRRSGSSVFQSIFPCKAMSLYCVRVLLAQACIEWNDGCYSDRNISHVTWSNSSQLLLNGPPKWAELLLFSSFPLIKLIVDCLMISSSYVHVGCVLVSCSFLFLNYKCTKDGLFVHGLTTALHHVNELLCIPLQNKNA